MIESNGTIENETQDGISNQMVRGGIYFTRFDRYETDQEFLFRCRMPDVELAQVEPRWRQGELVIQGKVRLNQGSPLSETGPKPLASFYRSFPIHRHVVPDQVSAHFHEGVLTVRLCKRGDVQS